MPVALRDDDVVEVDKSSTLASEVHQNKAQKKSKPPGDLFHLLMREFYMQKQRRD